MFKLNSTVNALFIHIEPSVWIDSNNWNLSSTLCVSYSLLHLACLLFDLIIIVFNTDYLVLHRLVCPTYLE